MPPAGQSRVAPVATPTDDAACALPAESRGTQQRKSGLPIWMTPRNPKGTEVPEFTKGVYSINYLHLYIIFAPIAFTIWGFMTTPLQQYTAFWAGICFCFSGLSITVGYHRLFSHCAYKAGPIFEFVIAFFGAGAFEGSIKWWARNHRIHHRYVDTDKDPYNATRGFLFTHLGWMMMNQNHEALGRVDVEDLAKNKIVMFQHKHYLPLALLSGTIIPIVVAGLGWGDWWGGFFYAFALKAIVVHQSTFFINSIAHFKMPGWLGSLQTYSDGHTTFDNWFVAILTNGEGYHNFHHEFPQDYRNGVRAWHWDPTKWVIRVAYVAGLVDNLVRFPGQEILKARLMQRYYTHQTEAHSLLNRLGTIEHGRSVETLPEMTRAEVAEQCSTGGRHFVIIDGIVYDFMRRIAVGKGATHHDSERTWYEAHPGGKRYLDLFRGKDATEAFRGKVYNHTLFAEQMLASLMIAKIAE